MAAARISELNYIFYLNYLNYLFEPKLSLIHGGSVDKVSASIISDNQQTFLEYKTKIFTLILMKILNRDNILIFKRHAICVRLSLIIFFEICCHLFCAAWAVLVCNLWTPGDQVSRRQISKHRSQRARILAGGPFLLG